MAASWSPAAERRLEGRDEAGAQRGRASMARQRLQGGPARKEIRAAGCWLGALLPGFLRDEAETREGFERQREMQEKEGKGRHGAHLASCGFGRRWPRS